MAASLRLASRAGSTEQHSCASSRSSWNATRRPWRVRRRVIARLTRPTPLPYLRLKPDPSDRRNTNVSSFIHDSQAALSRRQSCLAEGVSQMRQPRIAPQAKAILLSLLVLLRHELAERIY